ncbi:hypothetical protein ACLOJK_003613 [Asimina triloba]
MMLAAHASSTIQPADLILEAVAYRGVHAPSCIVPKNEPARVQLAIPEGDVGPTYQKEEKKRKQKAAVQQMEILLSLQGTRGGLAAVGGDAEGAAHLDDRVGLVGWGYDGLFDFVGHVPVVVDERAPRLTLAGAIIACTISHHTHLFLSLRLCAR